MTQPTNFLFPAKDSPIRPTQHGYTYTPQVAVFEEESSLELQTAMNAWLDDKAIPIANEKIFIRDIPATSTHVVGVVVLFTALIHYEVWTRL